MISEKEQCHEDKLIFFQDNLKRDLGHFNVLYIDEHPSQRKQTSLTYRRREFYKIKLFTGNFIYHFAGKSFEINGTGLIFINPDVPCDFEPLGDRISGYMAIFTDDFINRFGNIKEYPIFKPDGNPSFILNSTEKEEFEQIFVAMQQEITSDYLYKYDHLRNLVFEVIHKAMKTRPNEVKVDRGSNASSRISSLCAELLELQFPIEKPDQVIKLRTAQDFANQLMLHTNHLNRVVKQQTGKTTSQFIQERLILEAKALLKHTDWNITEISYCLGFNDTSHFISTFKRMVGFTPRIYRES